MSVNIMQFKSRIRNLAKEEGIPAQVMLQNFMFERFFARLCKSTVRENLILKGGALISQYLGISRRTTMDIDLTMSNAPLTESTVSEMIQGVFSVRLDDGVRWSLNVLEPFRKPLAEGRLFVVSPVSQSIRRVDARSAAQRNRCIHDHADKLLIKKDGADQET